MSRIIHILGPQFTVRLALKQLHITDKETGTDKSIPIEDMAALVCASATAVFTAGALRALAEATVPVLICDEQFQPAALTLPYYRATDTDLIRAQAAWTSEFREAAFRHIITAKVRAQGSLLQGHTAEALAGIADRCAAGQHRGASATGPGKSLARVTASRRELLHADTPAASESRAARLYWHRFMPPLVARLGTSEKGRVPGTRLGVNGMLDYGYAILRSAVLRSLACRGFIAALGLHHTSRAGTHALADDLMEPLRPFIDAALRDFITTSEAPEMKAWMGAAAGVLLQPVPMKTGQVRLLHAIDLYVQSFASHVLKPAARPAFTIPYRGAPPPR